MRKFINYFALVAVLVFSTACVRFVDETEHCVETRYGEVVNPQIESGPDWYLFTDATCFKLTEQQVEVTDIRVQTADSVPIVVDTVTFLFKYDPATVFDVFKDKRSESAAESEILKAAQAGIKESFAMSRVSDLFGAGYSSLNARLLEGIQRNVADRANVLSVFLGGKISLPEAIEQARLNTMTQVQNARAEQEKMRTDSIAAMNRILQSEANRQVAENNAAVYRENRVLADLEVEKARAAAIGEICKGVNTCIIGGTVADKFFLSQGN